MRKLIVLTLAVLGLLLVVPAAALAGPKTFCVHPSGGNDTAAIQAAFNAAGKAGPASTVVLSAGHFYTDTILVRNFHGYFKGASEGKTVIDSVRGVDPSAAGLTMTAVSPSWQSLFLFGFRGGHVNVSGMSFDITPYSPAAPWASDNETDLLTVFLVTGNASSSFDRVGFTAHAGDSDGYNVDTDIFIEGPEQNPTGSAPTSIAPTGGTHTVSHCSFFGRVGMRVEALTAGGLTVRDNVFDDYYCDLFSIEDSNSQIDISHNRMRCDGTGDNLILAQGWVELAPLPGPRYRITDNKMVASGIAGGVWLEDDSTFYGAPNRLHAMVADNTIALDNGGMDCGIDGFFAQGIRVLHNRISGTGLAGIGVGFASVVGGLSGPASGWRIIGNDVSGVNVANAYGDEPTAPIWLGPDADHCLVVGGCRPTTVLDQGTDDTLINVTPVTDPAAAAAMPIKSLKQMKQVKGMVLP